MEPSPGQYEPDGHTPHVPPPVLYSPGIHDDLTHLFPLGVYPELHVNDSFVHVALAGQA